MPAIDLTRLRTRLTRLKNLFPQPQLFIASLREIFSAYSDPTIPLDRYTLETHVLPAFDTPPLLGYEIEIAFSEFATTHPSQTLEIIDLLWQEKETELRQLAVTLLKKLPQEEMNSVIKRTLEWSSNKENIAILPFLHQQISSVLHHQDPQAWMQILEEWKNTGETWKIRMALKGLIPLIDDRNFANLPIIFTFLTFFFEKIDDRLQIDLQTILEKLAKRSEVETIYYLKQMIAYYPHPALGRFLRKSLEIFSASAQESLRVAMRKQEGLKHEPPVVF